MSEEKAIKEIHYNAFESIELQLARQKYKCKDIDIYEKAKDDILYLWIHNILTDNEKNKCIEKLHKRIIKSIREENY